MQPTSNVTVSTRCSLKTSTPGPIPFSVLLISHRSRMLSPHFWVPDIFTKNRKDAFLAFCRTSDCGLDTSTETAFPWANPIDITITTQSRSYFHFPLQCGIRLRRRDANEMFLPPIPGSLLPYMKSDAPIGLGFSAQIKKCHNHISKPCSACRFLNGRAFQKRSQVFSMLNQRQRWHLGFAQLGECTNISYMRL